MIFTCMESIRITDLSICANPYRLKESATFGTDHVFAWVYMFGT